MIDNESNTNGGSQGGKDLHFQIGVDVDLIKNQLEAQGYDYKDDRLEGYFQNIGFSIAALFEAEYITQDVRDALMQKMANQIKIAVTMKQPEGAKKTND